MKVVLDTSRLCSSTTERVIIHAISRDPADIVYINPALVLALPCRISTPRNHHTHIKTTFPYHPNALAIVGKKQNRIIVNAFRLTMLAKVLLGLP